MFHNRRWIVTLLVFALAFGRGDGLATAAPPSPNPWQATPVLSATADGLILEWRAALPDLTRRGDGRVGVTIPGYVQSDTPGAPRDAPGRPRDPPERPKSEPGRSRIDLWERSFRTVVRETLPERFSNVFGSLGGGPDVDSAAPCQCFARVERFSSKRPLDHKIDRKGSEIVHRSPQIAPESRPGHVPDTRRAQCSAGRAIFWGSGTSAGGAQRRGSDSEAQLSARAPNAPEPRQGL